MSAKHTAESFWARVNVRSLDECWPWLGAVNARGYGILGWHGESYLAPRVAAWLLGFVESPSAPRDRTQTGFVLHECDNPPCCNPCHFEISTLHKNQIDAYARGLRHPSRGADHVNAKLSASQAASIRRRYACGGTRQVDLAAEHKVSQRAISLIVRGETYI